MQNTVAHYCRIKGRRIVKDGELLFECQDISFQQFTESAYRHFEITYSKFHKMDALSKLGFLCSDILLKNNDLSLSIKPYSTGVILSNKNSSLDTDVRYYNMVKEGVASPAVFVYSLPNIVIGEICIRNGIKGENTFFISDFYDIPSQVEYINNLFDSGVMDACICGWVELMEESYDAFLYYAVKQEPGTRQMAHTTENINKLYQQL